MDSECHCGRCNGDGPDEPDRFELPTIHALGIAQCCFNCWFLQYAVCVNHPKSLHIEGGFSLDQYPRPAPWMFCPDWKLTDNKRRLSGMEREVKRWAKVSNDQG